MNPTDILDAYDRIRFAITNIDDTTAHMLIERALTKRAKTTAPAPQPVEPVAEHVKALQLAIVGKQHQREAAEKAAKNIGRESTVIVCDLCGEETRSSNGRTQHIRRHHWDAVIEAFHEDGIEGICETFGIGTGTAHNWADKIGDRAA